MQILGKRVSKEREHSGFKGHIRGFPNSQNIDLPRSSDLENRLS